MSGILTSPLNVPTPATSKIPVLTLSVAAIPVNAEPSPLNEVAVTTPVWNASPSLLRVIPLPTLISVLPVIIPTESILVTSS